MPPHTRASARHVRAPPTHPQGFLPPPARATKRRNAHNAEPADRAPKKAKAAPSASRREGRAGLKAAERSGGESHRCPLGAFDEENDTNSDQESTTTTLRGCGPWCLHTPDSSSALNARRSRISADEEVGDESHAPWSSRPASLPGRITREQAGAMMDALGQRLEQDVVSESNILRARIRELETTLAGGRAPPLRTTASAVRRHTSSASIATSGQLDPFIPRLPDSVVAFMRRGYMEHLPLTAVTMEACRIATSGAQASFDRNASMKQFDIAGEHRLDAATWLIAWPNFVQAVRGYLHAGDDVHAGGPTAQRIGDDFQAHFTSISRRSDFHDNFSIYLEYDIEVRRRWVLDSAAVSLAVWHEQLYRRCVNDFLLDAAREHGLGGPDTQSRPFDP